MYPLFSAYDGLALVVLRVALSAVFIAHGWSKLKDLKQTAQNFEGMGFKPGKLFGTLAAFLEFFGGIALIFGFLTMPIAGLFIVEFVVIIIWKLSKKMPLLNGWELDLLILGGVIVLFTLGAGQHSIDHALGFVF